MMTVIRAAGIFAFALLLLGAGRAEALTLEKAAAESGFSYSALEKLIRRGELPNLGQKGRPRVRRGDLPRKPTKPGPQAVGIPDIAEQVLSGRTLAHR